MAFDLQEMTAQVALAVGHDGLADKVPVWTNRVLQTIGCRAVWRSQLVTAYAATAATVATTTQAVQSQLNPLTSLSGSDVIQVYQVAHKTATVGTYYGVLRRYDLMDVYANYVGQTINKTTGGEVCYAIARYNAVTSGGTTTQFMVPQVAVYPQIQSGVLEVTFQQALTKLAASSDTNHFLQKYFTVVLAGVLRIARLYLGDVNGYMAAKAIFENGIREMVQAEEVLVASTPVLRGVDPGWYGR